MQLSKGAADRCGVDWQMAYDIEENISGGTCYLAIHMKTYNGRIEHVAYRYNGGGDPQYWYKVAKVYSYLNQNVAPTISVKVRSGDSLSILAARHLGDSSKWNVIADYNNIENPDMISIGIVLKIPINS